MKNRLFGLMLCVAVVLSTVLVGSAVIPVRAATLTVGPGGYATIQAAVNDAAPGDTISVAAGTYNEQITINKSVSIIGAGSDQTIITGGNPAVLLSATGTVTQPILLKDLQVLGVNGIRTDFTPVSYKTLMTCSSRRPHQILEWGFRWQQGTASPIFLLSTLSLKVSNMVFMT